MAELKPCISDSFLNANTQGRPGTVTVVVSTRSGCNPKYAPRIIAPGYVVKADAAVNCRLLSITVRIRLRMEVDRRIGQDPSTAIQASHYTQISTNSACRFAILVAATGTAGVTIIQHIREVDALHPKPCKCAAIILRVAEFKIGGIGTDRCHRRDHTRRCEKFQCHESLPRMRKYVCAHPEKVFYSCASVTSLQSENLLLRVTQMP